MCSAELLPREAANGPSDVNEGWFVALPPGEEIDEAFKANGASEVSEVVEGCGAALMLAVPPLGAGGILRDDQEGNGGGDPVGWILAPALTLADGF